MEYKEDELKEGIKLHVMDTDKFKTNLIAIFLTTKLDRNDVTKNADLLSNETGVKVYKLDSAITGSVEKDAYVDIMEYNLGIFMELKE